MTVAIQTNTIGYEAICLPLNPMECGLFHRPRRPPRRPPDAFPRVPRVPALASVRSPCAAGPGDGSRRGLGCG
jgi:hypothetical protein